MPELLLHIVHTNFVPGDSVMQQKAYDLRCRNAAGCWEDSEKAGLAQKARAGQGVASKIEEALNLQRSFEAPKKL